MDGVVSFGRAMLRSNRLSRPRVTRCFVCVAFAAFADFGPVSRSEAGEKNGRERVEGGPGRGHGPDAEVRRFPQESREHAGVGAIGQEKTPTENGWGLGIGGAGGNRTRVRKSSATSSTCVVTSL